jgi:hypothetical protein
MMDCSSTTRILDDELDIIGEDDELSEDDTIN